MTTTAAPPPVGDNGARTVHLVGDFIKSQLATHQASFRSQGLVAPPLVVGVQGPQGCGKSHLTSLLPAYLSSSSPPITTATLSLDDLYLPHTALTSLAASHPSNLLLQGRGQPGTHDLPLGTHVFSLLRSGSPASLPTFDKSLFGGQGDRSHTVVSIASRVDVVIFEGWMLGFAPLPAGEVRRRWEDRDGGFVKGLDYDQAFVRGHKVEDLEWVNAKLEEYVEELWMGIGCFVMLRPKNMEYVWEWRLEQEHNMKKNNGGIGMTDAEVKAFIARYMPGYELFMEGIESPAAPWKGKGLKLSIGRSREVVATEQF